MGVDLFEDAKPTLPSWWNCGKSQSGWTARYLK